MCVKPWPIEPDQLLLAAHLAVVAREPAGRSDAASRSLMIQQNARGSSPCAQRPFTSTASGIESRAIDTSSSRNASRAARGRRAPARRARRGRAPTPTVARVPSSRVGEVGAVAERRAEERLARRADEHRARRPRATSSSRRASSSRLCAAVLPKPMPGRRTSAPASMPAARATSSALDEEVADLGDDVVVVRVRPASCAARPACASRRARRRPRRRRASISGSTRPAETSFTIVAPASSAASATAAFVVSMLTGTPGLGGERARRPGSTRRAPRRPSTGVGAGPGRLAADVEHVGARGHQREAVARPRRRGRGSGRRRRRSRA